MKSIINIAFVIMIAVLILPFAAVSYGYHALTKTEIAGVEVAHRERITSSDDSKYVHYTSHGVFENTDSLWACKWDSHDMYMQLTTGAVCDLTTVGLRVPFLSMTPNIVEADCG